MNIQLKLSGSGGGVPCYGLEAGSAFGSGNRPSLQFFRSPLLANAGGLIHAFTTCTGGVSPPPYNSLNLSSKTGDSDENVSENLRILTAELGIERAPLFMDQVHGDNILIIDDLNPKDSMAVSALASSADAAITSCEGVPLVVITADCLPILLYDAARSVAAVVHAGWKGTSLNIAGKTVAAMTKRFGCKPADIIAAMGPFIGPCCYEVDERVVSSFESFIKARPDVWSKVFSPSEALSAAEKAGRWMFDLAGANLLQLNTAGIPYSNVSLSPYCTCCSDGLFYSHRRDGEKTGRQGAILMINKNGHGMG
ncbi:MAG: peptidoglycan editing factor PgeF [bacterium]|nr:peptidoglycan editing factor PgeF [bacterium]